MSYASTRINGLSIPSGNTKLGKIPSISLPPLLTCPPNPPCARDCYALKFERIWPSVKAAWAGNLRTWQESPTTYMSTLDIYLTKHKPPMFRWHVAGDIPDTGYLAMMIALARAHPHTRFMAYTKHVWALKARQAMPTTWPPNLTLRYSTWPGRPIPPEAQGIPLSWLSEDPRKPKASYHCPAVGSSTTTCYDCRACWMPSVKSIGIPKH